MSDVSQTQDAKPAFSSTREGASDHSPVVRPNSEQWDITSGFTGRTYRIYVAKPISTSQVPPEGYPVVYVTDGDFLFHTFADTLAFQAEGLEARHAYVVGIGYGHDREQAARLRFADLTPTLPDPATRAALDAIETMRGAVFGEAELFHRFLTEELRPQIEASYATNSADTTLFGDSLGGLFALYVLFNYPGSYRTYLVGSPSITFSECAILKDEHKLAAPLAAGAVLPRVFIAVGEYEEALADHVKVHPSMTREQKQAYLSAAAMVTNALALADRLKALNAPAVFELEAVLFERETHLSVVPACISRSVRFALLV